MAEAEKELARLKNGLALLEDQIADCDLENIIRQFRVGSSRSVPAGPSRPSAAPRDIGQLTPFRQWGAARPKSCHLRGRATAKTAHKPSLFPRRASDVQGVTDFLPCRWNPLQCWVLGVQGASAGTDVFLLAEHASETSPKTITFLLKPAPLLGSSVQQA